MINNIDTLSKKINRNILTNKKEIILIKDDYINDIESENINDIESEDINDNESIELLEKELIIKAKSNSMKYPKNYGNIWLEKERKIILKYLKNYEINKDGFFNEDAIIKIAKKIERTEYGIKEEIKKMIFNDFMLGHDNKYIENKFNICEQNIKLIIKLYMEKNGKKIINMMETENKIISLQIENIKLKNELKKILN